jgi:hypothetical protein
MSKDDFNFDPLDYHDMFDRDSSKLRFPEPGESPEFDKLVTTLKAVVGLQRREQISKAGNKT